MLYGIPDCVFFRAEEVVVGDVGCVGLQGRCYNYFSG